MRVIDSHTGGEPTRVILDGGPDLGHGTLAQRARYLSEHHMTFCQSVLREPRGQPAMVGALLVPPSEPGCEFGVIYFDADAVLGMCGHGTIGLMVTLAHMGRISAGVHQIDTPAGVISVALHDQHNVSVTNVESRRTTAGAHVTLADGQSVVGDVAYGGNWFFLIEQPPLELRAAHIPQLTALAHEIRRAANAQGVAGPGGEPIDHVVLLVPSPRENVAERNFVFCPDGTYDRSPCGTGCSARLACLAADGRLAAGQEIEFESIIGSSYQLSYAPGQDGGIIPTLKGQAFVMAESQLLFDPADPFQAGIPVNR